MKARQSDLLVLYAGAVAATRNARLNATKRRRSLLSGLVRCGVCGGPCSLRGQGRFACSAHTDDGGCSNGNTITRTALEERVLVGLRDRLMAPEIAAEAVRAYVEETNRLRREDRLAEGADRKRLLSLDKEIDGLVDAVAERRTSEVRQSARQSATA